jgi:tetratricopeptide (TPR) repeat protein
MPAAEGSRLGAAARADELRRAVTAATDGALRARLRVQLAELVRSHDPVTALDELRRAAAEAPGLPVVTMAALSMARALPPSERLKWLSELGGGVAPPVAAWSAALAEAYAQIGAVDRAAAAWLELARDDRAPPHRRRVAARHAESLAAGVAPDVQRAALRLSAGFTQGSGRLGFLRRALALAGAHAPADELLALAAEWLEAGGDGRVADAALSRARAGGAAPPALDRLSAEAARRRPLSRGERPAMIERRKVPRPPAGKIVAGDPRRVSRPSLAPVPRAAAGAPTPPDEIFESALVHARAGHANRACRLAAEALRSGPLSDALTARVASLESALREAGYVKQALHVRRTYAEGLAGEAQRAVVTSLAVEAEQAGLATLARAWRADAGLPPAPAAPAPSQPVTAADHYLHAQRLLAQLPPESAADGFAGVEPVVTALIRALAGHAGADEALALAHALLARLATGEELERQRLELLRTAHAGEVDLARQLRLADRLAQALERLEDPVGAVAVLERAIEAAGPGEGARLRGQRARLLRAIGRGRDLAAALEGDAGALAGDERLAALTERAALLDGAGEPERALEVRLMTLAEFPADLAVLGAARRRLESTGRPAESLRLAVAAVERVAEGAEKLRLLRDIAVLSEKSTANPAEAAAVWLAVLESDPEDTGACEAAERLLMAVGDWERCADLLSWAASRSGAVPGPSSAPARASRLWRLAELRRARLGQPEEALRLYGELVVTASAPQGALVDEAEMAAVIHRDPVLRLETARAAVAPTAADRARALIDRAVALLDRGRPGDAERDGMLALDLDPSNVDIIRVLERIHDGGSRWAELGQQLRQRAAALPPVAAARLFYGVGRAAERLGDRATAREAYRRALSLDGAFPEPIGALGALAARDGDWNEVAALLQSEVALTGSPARKGRLLAELAAVHGERLANIGRAVELLDAALALLPEEVRILDLASRFNLQAGRWEVAAQALDRLASSGAAIPDAAERYYQAGAAAEATGAADRALILYSRSYARQSSYRPTLERLSAICFARDQWDNTWKATEALLDRHAAALERPERAALLVRSALADLHIGQRAAAQARLATVVTRGGSFIPDVGIRDVAESWGGMRLEPRLLAGADRMRRERAAARAREAAGLTAGPVRREALEILGALAVVEERWEDALTALRELAGDDTLTPADRAGFVVAAGDILAHKHSDREGAERLYEEAAALHPNDGRLVTRLPGVAVVEDLAHDVTDEMPV